MRFWYITVVVLVSSEMEGHAQICYKTIRINFVLAELLQPLYYQKKEGSFPANKWIPPWIYRLHCRSSVALTALITSIQFMVSCAGGWNKFHMKTSREEKKNNPNTYNLFESFGNGYVYISIYIIGRWFTLFFRMYSFLVFFFWVCGKIIFTSAFKKKSNDMKKQIVIHSKKISNHRLFVWKKWEGYSENIYVKITELDITKKRGRIFIFLQIKGV